MLVVNPASRRGNKLRKTVRAELLRLGIEPVDDAVSGRGIEAIVVGGGDGTLMREIPRAVELGIPIGVVPLGTVNDLARTLSIPLDVEGACAVIASGRTRTIDAARVNGVYYVTEASIGISSRLARIQRPQEKQRFGLLAVIASIFHAAGYTRPFHAEITYDGGHACLRTIQLTIANSPRFGGFIIDRAASIEDGRLDCYSVQVDNAGEFWSVVRAILRGRRSAQGLRTFRSPTFYVWTRRPHRISADGEPAGRTPARFEVLPGALRIFAP